MNFYGIVTNIKEEQVSGIYGRTIMKKNVLGDLESKNIFVASSKGISKNLSFVAASAVLSLAIAGSRYYEKLKKDDSNEEYPIKLQKPINAENKILVIPNELLLDNYKLDDDFSYGLLDGVGAGAFRKLMRSQGGSDLTIMERRNLPSNFKHIGGSQGTFSEGLYAPHPKDENILIPLKDFTTLIQSLTLEETIRAYEALGAKKIIIEDVTNLNVEIGGNKNAVKASGKSSLSKEILREKHFGKGSFDVKRAEENKLFIADIPAITTVIEARKEGNIIREKFTEHINLNIGVDIGVAKLFSGGINVSHSRKWAFEVEFWDKNEL